MVKPQRGYTLEMRQRLPQDGNRYELLDGELIVTPSPLPVHQTLVARLTALSSYVDAHALGRVWPGIDMFHGRRTVSRICNRALAVNPLQPSRAEIETRLLPLCGSPW